MKRKPKDGVLIDRTYLKYRMADAILGKALGQPELMVKAAIAVALEGVRIAARHIERNSRMDKREYHQCKRVDGDNHRQTGVAVRCSECTNKMEVWDDKNAPPQLLRKRFMKNGWQLGAGPGNDRCPDCAYKKTPSVVTQLKPPAPKADKPREMSLTDRRIINSKLEDVYIDEKDGYSPPWTDRKVAEDLGCPAAWVGKMRVENFGPIASNREIDDLLDECRTALRKAATLCDAVLEKSDTVDALVEDISGVWQIRKDLGSLESRCRRIEKAVA